MNASLSYSSAQYHCAGPRYQSDKSKFKIGVISGTKLADTDCGEFIVTVQVPFPLHAPDQPVNILPGSGVATNVTLVFGKKKFEQVEPQFITGDGGDVLVIVPVPVPSFVTVKGSNRVKLADTDLLVSKHRLHLSIPLHAPDQPLNALPGLGIAVNVTPTAYNMPHTPQFLSTAPVPVPTFVTVNV